MYSHFGDIRIAGTGSMIFGQPATNADLAFWGETMGGY